MIRTRSRIRNSKIGQKVRIHLNPKNISKISFFLSSVFLIGVLTGGLILNSFSPEKTSAFRFIFESFVQNRAGQSILTTFFNSFLSSMIPILLAFLFGFSAVAAPFTVSLCYVKGLGIGMALGFLYQNFGLLGFLYSLCLVIPYSSIASISLLMACKKSILFSDILFRFLFLSEKTSTPNHLPKLYFMKFLSVFYLIVFSSFVDMIFSFIFSNLFRFNP